MLNTTDKKIKDTIENGAPDQVQNITQNAPEPINQTATTDKLVEEAIESNPTAAEQIAENVSGENSPIETEAEQLNDLNPSNDEVNNEAIKQTPIKEKLEILDELRNAGSSFINIPYRIDEQTKAISDEYNKWKANEYAGKDLASRQEMGQFYTPPELTTKMLSKFEDLNGTILDPTAGAGHLLAGAIMAGADPNLVYANEPDANIRNNVLIPRLVGLGVPLRNIGPYPSVVKKFGEFGKPIEWNEDKINDYISKNKESDVAKFLDDERRKYKPTNEEINAYAAEHNISKPSARAELKASYSPKFDEEDYLNKLRSKFATKTGIAGDATNPDASYNTFVETDDEFLADPDNKALYDKIYNSIKEGKPEEAVETIIEESPEAVKEAEPVLAGMLGPKKADEVIGIINEEAEQITGDTDKRNDEVNNANVEKALSKVNENDNSDVNWDNVKVYEPGEDAPDLVSGEIKSLDDSQLPALNLQDYHKDLALNGERDLETTDDEKGLAEDVDYTIVEDSGYVPPTYTIEDLDREIEETRQLPVTNAEEAKEKQNKLKKLKARRVAYGGTSSSDTNWNYDKSTATGGKVSPRAGIGSIGGAAGHGSMTSTKSTKISDNHNSIASKAPLPNALEDNQGKVVSVNGKATTAPSSNNNGAFRSGSFGLMSKAKSNLKSIKSKAPVSGGPKHMENSMEVGKGISADIGLEDGKQILIERLKQLLTKLTDEEKRKLGFSPALNQWSGKALVRLDGYTLQDLIDKVEEYLGEK